MRKVILLALMVTFLPIVQVIRAQNAESIVQPASIVQKIDTTYLNRIVSIENRLMAYQKHNRASQYLMITSGALFALNVIFPSKKTETTNLRMFGGIGCAFIGGAIYLDSFTFLNFKKNKK